MTRTHIWEWQILFSYSSYEFLVKQWSMVMSFCERKWSIKLPHVGVPILDLQTVAKVPFLDEYGHDMGKDGQKPQPQCRSQSLDQWPLELAFSVCWNPKLTELF